MINHYNPIVAYAFIAYMLVCVLYLLIFIIGIVYKLIGKLRKKV